MKAKHEWSDKMILLTRASQREIAFAAFEFNESGMQKVGAGFRREVLDSSQVMLPIKIVAENEEATVRRTD